MLSEEEIEYYSRQLLVDDLGVSGQLKLKQSKVLIIGAGGLGCPVLQYLTAVGVGTIGIIDGDDVEISNLHRQILFSTSSLGKNKAIEAKIRLKALNPFISIHTFDYNLTLENAIEIISNYDYIVDCTDNYETRFLVNDACVFLDLPLIYGSIYRFEGQVSVFNYQNGPTYRCLFPVMPTEESTTNCSLSGVIGVLPGIIGVLQASEAIKLITGFGEIVSGKVLVYNARTNSTDFFLLNRDLEVNYAAILFDGKLHAENYTFNCSNLQQNSLNEIDHFTLLEGKNVTELIFLDVRESHELPAFISDDVLPIPLSDLENQLDKIPRNGQIVVFCKSGIRSKKAIGILQNEFNYENLVNLSGGISTQFIKAWQTKKK